MANRDILELVFKHSGGVELRVVSAQETESEVDTVVWASDSDQDFMDEFGNELFDAGDKDELEKIITYLVDADILDDDEADELQIWSEALDGRDVGTLGDDPGDDDDDEDDDEDVAA